MRILFLTRFYPPEISGGARRPHSLVQALRALGVSVTICAPSGIVDEDYIGVPHPIFPAVLPGEQSTSPASKPSAKNWVTSVLDWVRKSLLLPDPEIRWAMRAMSYVRAQGNAYDWIMTSSPPESLHIAGALLKQHLGAKWVADVRDMWITSPQRPELSDSKLRAWIERAMARWCFARVDGLIAVSPALISEMKTYAPANLPMCVIGHFAATYNGNAEVLPSDTFNIVHTGSVELSNPLSEFSQLLNDFETLAARDSRVRLWLAGRLSESEMSRIANSMAASKVITLGPVDMDRARALQLGADALALVSGSRSHALPGKFSEYSQTGKPILISAAGQWCDLIPSDTRLVSWDSLDTSALRGDDQGQAVSQNSSARCAAQKLLDFLQTLQR